MCLRGNGGFFVTTSPFQVLVSWLSSVNQVARLTYPHPAFFETSLTLCSTSQLTETCGRFWQLMLSISGCFLSWQNQRPGKHSGVWLIIRSITGWLCGFMAGASTASFVFLKVIILTAEPTLATDYQQSYERGKPEVVFAALKTWSVGTSENCWSVSQHLVVYCTQVKKKKKKGLIVNASGQSKIGCLCGWVPEIKLRNLKDKLASC